MNRPLVGSADLARIFSAFSRAPRGVIADLLGWEEREPAPEPLAVPKIGSHEGPVEGRPPEPLPESTGAWPGSAEECPFWRATRFSVRAVTPTSEIVAAQPGQLKWRGRTGAAPEHPDLCPWPALIPRLRSGLQARKQAHRVDWDRVVDQTARGVLVRRLPCRSLKRWGERVRVIIDRSERLVPYWEDQVRVLNRLRRIIPEHGLEVFVGSSPDDAQLRPLAQSGPGASVLVLGDLGGLQVNGGRLQEEWKVWGQELRASDCHPLALVPCAAECVPAALRHTFRVHSWQRLPHAHVRTPDDRQAAVERLLRLVSPAIRVEPGLLRDVRALLPGPGEAAADASLEAELWQHPAVVSRHVAAASLDPELAKDGWMPQFEHEPKELRRKVLWTIRSWRYALAPEVWLQEVARLAAGSRKLLPPEDWEDARSALNYLATVAAAPGGETAAVKDYLGRAFSRLTRAAWVDREIGPVCRLLHRAVYRAGREPPEGWDPAEADRGSTTLTVEVRQRGGELAFVPVEQGRPGSRSGGSPLGFLRTTNREIRVDADWRDDTFWVGGTPPPWADQWGRDRYGPWVSFRVGNVVQRLRWVPAGRFLMGSPESEEGRWEAEGPRHEVAISWGFWLFATPCTQELWEAVMGSNPSQFRDPRRPVEQVSFVDVGGFLGRINEQVEGLGLSLPTEAQWEYACRAGAEGARYGSLDEVAWHEGNSGGETHEVGSKAANGWGLYDMLGNVWERCIDGMRSYADKSLVDPVGPTEAGAERTVRGGGWSHGARLVRAAVRDAIRPGYRLDFLGFRCLSSGRHVPAGVEPAAEVGGRKAEPGLQPEQPGGTFVVKLGDSESENRPLPRTPTILIRSDSDDVILERGTRPSWATAIGRDRFGLWATFEVEGKGKSVVVQRMRWVPPGRFRMGSPDTESGRYDDEGPQHEVVISRGFWLFDTPCPQELWSAVMSTNPSRFQDPRRPVEQVSFEDVGGFLGRINEQVEGLGLSLPTEAQWEYACRAGTTTSTYAGDVAIVGENNAPGLDEIAWYGGNSGRKYDLETGEDTNDWSDKQYPDSKAGTRRVGSKAANGWGLYDMLGNVLEWCVDGMRKYTDKNLINPIGPMGAVVARVFRGGSWSYDARDVRAAFRFAKVPGYRFGNLGFRCLSSGRPSEEGAGRNPAKSRPTSRSSNRRMKG